MHLPWYGTSFHQAAVPLRVLAEYCNYLNKRSSLSIQPKAGEVISYNKWMTHKALYNSRMEVMFQPTDTPPDTTIENWYKMLVFAMDNTNYQSLMANCQQIEEKDLMPGDLFIGLSEDGKEGFAYIILNMIIDKKKNKKYCVATGCVEPCDMYIPKVTEDRNSPWLTVEELKNIGPLKGSSGFYRFANVKL